MPQGTRCTAQSRSGHFCDAPAAPDAPFPICPRHALELWRYMKAAMDEMRVNRPDEFTNALLGRPLDTPIAKSPPRPSVRDLTKFTGIYYLAVGNEIKIGWSDDIRRRLESYPPSRRLLAIEPGDKRTEARRHRRFAEHLSSGREWFRPAPPLMTWINAVVDEHGDPVERLAARQDLADLMTGNRKRMRSTPSS